MFVDCFQIEDARLGIMDDEGVVSMSFEAGENRLLPPSEPFKSELTPERCWLRPDIMMFAGK